MNGWGGTARRSELRRSSGMCWDLEASRRVASGLNFFMESKPRSPQPSHTRSHDWRSRIVSDPDIRHGEAVIRGTRIAVSTIVASLADLSIDDLLREFPQLTRADIEAALLYAAEASRNTLVA